MGLTSAAALPAMVLTSAGGLAALLTVHSVSVLSGPTNLCQLNPLSGDEGSICGGFGVSVCVGPICGFKFEGLIEKKRKKKHERKKREKAAKGAGRGLNTILSAIDSDTEY